MDTIKKGFNMTTVIVFMVAFLLGYGTSVQIAKRNRVIESAPKEALQIDGVMPESSLADISAAAPEPVSRDSITADDQPAGTHIMVAVKAEKEVWAVVHEERGGKPGNILGAQIFPAGAHSGKIDLLRGTMVGQKYYVILHADNGDRAFNHADDLPMKNGVGELIMDSFMTVIMPPMAQ